MKKSKFSEEQIATAFCQVDAIPEVTRTLRINEATYYVWRKRYGQMAAARSGAYGSSKKTASSSNAWRSGAGIRK